MIISQCLWRTSQVPGKEKKIPDIDLCTRYGGPAPLVNGSIVMDLHRMNKILEVNEKFAFAVVEPGVTFADLYAYCAKEKLKVWPSTASLGWGSVVGNVSLIQFFHSGPTLRRWLT